MVKKEKDFIEPVPMEAPPQRSYKYAATIFFLVAIVLVVAIFYLVLAKVTITLIPKSEPVTKSFELTIAETPETSTSTNPVVTGKVYVEKVSTTADYQVTESQKTVEAKAGGQVVIYNTRNQAQTLVATTRLLSKEGVLFRLENQVTVPANGEVTASAKADKPGKAGEIPATSFTIPGLSADLQKMIYAESSEPMKGGERKIGVLSEVDIENAIKQFKQTELEKVVSKITAGMEQEKWLLIGSGVLPEEQKFSYDKKVGEEVDGFQLTGEITVVAVFAEKQVVWDKAQEIVASENKAVDLDESSLKYELTTMASGQKEATAKIEIAGVANFDKNKNIFDKNILVGFTESDLRLYFSQFDAVKDIQVQFSPFWVKKVPIFKDHILIQMQEK